MRDLSFRGRLLFLLSCCIILAALIGRRPDAFSNPQFHAEEGKYFFADAYHEGYASVFNTLNGYYHVLPRLLMSMIEDSAIPYAYLPGLYFVFVLLIYLGLIVVLWRKLPFNDTGRFFSSLAVFLLPLGNEILLTMTNIQWLTALVIFLVFFGKPARGLIPGILDSLFLFFACFTGPFSLIMLPLIVVRLIIEWRRGELRAAQLFHFLLLLTGAAFTAWSLYVFGTVSRTDDLTVAGEFGALRYIFYQFSYPLFIGWIHDSPVALFFTGSILCTILFLWFFYKAIVEKRSFAVWSCAFSALFMIVTLASYKDDPGALSPQYVAIRNFFLPSVFLCWALVAFFQDKRRFVLSATTLSAWFVVQTVIFIGPASFTDLHWREHSRRIDKNDTTMIPLNPPGWFVELDYNKMRENKTIKRPPLHSP